jgi:hypothetical protein
LKPPRAMECRDDDVMLSLASSNSVVDFPLERRVAH